VASTAPESVCEAPLWAEHLLAAVCNRYHVVRPNLDWRQPQENPEAIWCTVGDYNPNHMNVIVYESGDRLMDKMTLLHEIAHHIGFCRTGHDDHSELFWRYCWTLYRAYGIPLHVAVLSEFSYMARAEKVLLAMGIRLSPQARIAAALGNAKRKAAGIYVRTRQLETRLLHLRAEHKRKSVKRSLRGLGIEQAHVSRLETRHARAYKRVLRRG
jgi:hypothetical protein